MFLALEYNSLAHSMQETIPSSMHLAQIDGFLTETIVISRKIRTKIWFFNSLVLLVLL